MWLENQLNLNAPISITEPIFKWQLTRSQLFVDQFLPHFSVVTNSRAQSYSITWTSFSKIWTHGECTGCLSTLDTGHFPDYAKTSHPIIMFIYLQAPYKMSNVSPKVQVSMIDVNMFWYRLKNRLFSHIVFSHFYICLVYV